MQLSSISRFAVIALTMLFIEASQADAETVLQFDFGASAANGDLSLATGFGTVDDADNSTPGNQTSSVSFTGFLDPMYADILANGSVTFDGIGLQGIPVVVGNSIFQSTSGGNFSVFDDQGDLLLAGTLSSGLLSGEVGSSTASFFTTAPISFGGGVLSPHLGSPASGVSLALNSVDSGGTAGLVVSGNSLSAFSADATGQLEATAVPEPAAFGALAGLLILGLRRSRRRPAPERR